MFYTIYKTTNLLNGKIYIGKHQTKDLNDDYMGSGKNIKRAISKYGLENFKKEILFVFDNEKEMNDKEAELVNEEFVLREDTYNICFGGQGGFGYINSTPDLRTKGHDESMYEKISYSLKNKPSSVHNHPNKIAALKKMHSDGVVNYNTFLGKKHSEETKEKMSSLKKGKYTGEENSQYGTVWITNGKDNKKIKRKDILPDNWWYGATHEPPSIKKTLYLCKNCLQKEEDFYYWNVFLESDMSITNFVKELYPYNRATFYNMKKRMLKY